MKKNYYTFQKVGEKLQERRLKRGISLKQIAKELKIREKFLKALESGEYEIFPSEVYIKGFLKNYSEFLGMDSERLLKLYRRDREKVKNSSSLGNLREKGKKEMSFNLKLSYKKGMIGMVVALIIITIGYFGVRLYLYSKKPVLILQEPLYANSAENIEYKFDTTKQEVIFKGNIGIGNSLHVNNERIETFGRDEFETPPQEVFQGENIFQISTKNQYGVTSELIINVIRSENI
ncbi:helix-turn-helix domain-containing protein [Candidatus Dojkabacteria bacterium]|nr:helix-turn-helix domain-containing protein [Candidatus Dojkabacteria bacterium]